MSTSDWISRYVFKLAVPARALCWVPHTPGLLLAGCGNGDLIELDLDLDNDCPSHRLIENFPGLIGSIAISSNGNQVAVSYGDVVSLSNTFGKSVHNFEKLIILTA